MTKTLVWQEELDKGYGEDSRAIIYEEGDWFVLYKKLPFSSDESLIGRFVNLDVAKKAIPLVLS